MDLIEAKFDIQIPDKYKKYGWTNNVKALVAYEYLHDLKLAIFFMHKDPNTYFYMLKRFINKGSSNHFKKFFSAAQWNIEHIESIKSLFWRAVHKNNYSVANYLINKFKKDFNFSLDTSIHLLYECKSNRMSILIYKNFIEENSIFKRIPFSVWCNIHDFAQFNNDRVLKFLLDINVNRYYNIFDNNKKEEPLSLKETLALFGYKYQPRN
jgi:hypothetical protein